MFPSKGNRNLQHRPVQFVSPSISKPQTAQLSSRPISSEKKNINYSVSYSYFWRIWRFV
ncbi:unnamed protein product [Brugia timori]|uniref:Uncharacterized protein n=1 Tax=Brugia timori TaxID=42155 RepID=A0A0R3R9Z1_9BILA|nr:unnamed protein product [Brugia timori]